MSGGVMAVSCLVAALVVCETILPRLRAALPSWLRKVAASKKHSDAPEKAAASPVPLGAEREVPEMPQVQRQSPSSVSAVAADYPQEAETPPDGDAERLWSEARAMSHNFIPTFAEDGVYLGKVLDAAKRGHREAMAKLGEYAYRRGALVEAYYWTALSDLKGAEGLVNVLRQIESEWVMSGCPMEYDNVYDGYSEQQGSFARALLRIRCVVDLSLGRVRMRELAKQNCEEARLFMR